MVNKGVVGYNYRRACAQDPDNYVKNNDLLIEGNVGIGTTNPEVKTGQSGFLDVKDVWVRDADGGNGAWASEGGEGAFIPDPMVGDNDSSGEIIFPNGFQMKWGAVSVSGGERKLVTFSTPFPNACIQAYAAWGVDIGDTGDSPGVYALSPTSMRIKNGNGGGGIYTRWFAIGR